MFADYSKADTSNVTRTYNVNGDCVAAVLINSEMILVLVCNALSALLTFTA